MVSDDSPTTVVEEGWRRKNGLVLLRSSSLLRRVRKRTVTGELRIGGRRDERLPILPIHVLAGGRVFLISTREAHLIPALYPISIYRSILSISSVHLTIMHRPINLVAGGGSWNLQNCSAALLSIDVSAQADWMSAQFPWFPAQRRD